MEKLIFTILENGSYGSRPMTHEELQEHEAIVANAQPIIDRIHSEDLISDAD